MAKRPNRYGVSTGPGDVKSEAEAKARGFTDVDLWLAKIDKQKSDKDHSRWFKQARAAVNNYEAGEPIEGETNEPSAANLFHANVETIAPSVYNSTPIPDIRVRYGELNKAAKKACDLFERVASFDIDECDFDDVMVEGVRKTQIVGEGLLRVRYEATIEEVPEIDEMTGEPAMEFNPETFQHDKPITSPHIVDDKVWPEPVSWDRIIFGPATNFRKLPWIAFDHDLTYEEIKKLNEEVADQLSFGNRGSSGKIYGRNIKDRDLDAEAMKTGILATVKVYEIWDLGERAVWWVTPDRTEGPILKHADPFRLRQFFPLVKPLRPKSKVDKMTPQVPYELCRRLYNEFDRTSGRIEELVNQCRVKGWVDARLSDTIAQLRDLRDGEYLASKAAEEWLSGNAGKGLADAIAHWPLEMIVAALEVLVPQRQRTKEMIWEASGVSDIMRGSSDPNETLGAQELKSQYGSMRLRNMQQAAAEYACNTIDLMVEVRANLTPWERLKEIAMMDFAPSDEDLQQAMEQVQSEAAQAAPPPPGQMQGGLPPGAAGPSMGERPPHEPQMDQAAMQAQAQQMAEQAAQEFEQQVMEVCQSPRKHLIIDIDTDSTIRADVSRDMDQFNGLIEATGSFAGAITGMAPILPMTIPPLFRVFASQVRKFRLGSEGEDALDELMEAAKHPPVNPDAEPESADPMAMEEAQKQRDHEKEMEQIKLQTAQAKQQGDIAKIDKQTEAKAQEVEINRANAEIENESADANLNREIQLAEVQSQLGLQQTETEARYAEQESQRRAEGDRVKHENAMQQNAMKRTIADPGAGYGMPNGLGGL